jgi:hypothetical protein
MGEGERKKKGFRKEARKEVEGGEGGEGQGRKGERERERERNEGRWDSKEAKGK